MLEKIHDTFEQLDVGLYRDDGLGCYPSSMPGPDVERLKKDMISIFRSEGLRITIDTNMTQVNFLDITLNLDLDKFWPYRKPNDEPLYIHVQSNHPPSIKKQIPISTEKRLSSISCNEAEFEKAKPLYQAALEKSGYKHKLTYQPSTGDNPVPRRRNRSRNVTWFNPPFNQAVNQNVGKSFLQLIDKHFKPGHKYRCIFNRQTIKISYSCMPNMKAKLSSHNKAVLQEAGHRVDTKPEAKPCNCQKSRICPVNGECQTPSIVYEATVEAPDKPTKTYVGMSERPFKTRLYEHTTTFNRKPKDGTALSKYIWELKDQGLEPTVKWKILRKPQPYRCGTGVCDLCTSEK